jgi:hypothetical protein
MRPALVSNPIEVLTYVIRIISNLSNKIAGNQRKKCCCYSATLSTTTKVNQLGAMHVTELKNHNFKLHKQKLNLLPSINIRFECYL